MCVWGGKKAFIISSLFHNDIDYGLWYDLGCKCLVFHSQLILTPRLFNLYICILYTSSVIRGIYTYTRSVVGVGWCGVGVWVWVWGVGVAAECHFLFSLVSPIVSCIMINSLILGWLWPLVFVLNNIFTLSIFAFCNLSPPRMFLSLDLFSEYRIQHGAIGPLYVTSSYSTWIFILQGDSGIFRLCNWLSLRRLVSWITTCLLHIGPPFGNRLLIENWAVGLT